MLNLARTDIPQDEPPAPPQVFVRAFSTPPGAPWEQGRAAALEARHGAPLPIADLVHRVRRLESWAPGAPGRYAAFYVRAREFTRPFETTVEVDGRAVKIAFGAAAEQFRRAQTLGVAAAAAILSLLVVGGGVTLALGAKAETTARLERAEQQLLVKRRAALAAQQRSDQSRALQRAMGTSRPIDEVMADLAWATAMKAPDARIEAVHWEGGLLAVEARGETTPFANSDRRVQRSDKPLRKGVWLWGVEPRGASR